MTNLYEELAWLLPAPLDFPTKVADAVTGRGLQELATFALDDNNLRRLTKRLRQLQGKQSNLSPLVDVKIGILSNSTTKLVTTPLVGTALRFGLALEVVEAEFDQIAQEAFSEASSFTGQDLSAVLISIDYRGLPFVASPGDASAGLQNVQDCLAYIRSVIESVRTKSGAQILVQNFALPAESLSGSYEGRLPGTLMWLLNRLNSELDTLASDNTFIVDIAGLATNVGLANWHDPTLWNIAKLPFAQKYLPIYADYIGRILAARLGKSRRCLILDLDNTLWGGVIGDDGMDGILIGNGDATGEAHLHVQKIALELRGRGVVLAVSSKNEDATARQPFLEHPDMLLKENHIAVFLANWSDKASNIRAIAATLSLGLDSMVFLDDNPAERLQVRRELPEVAVPELPTDPALYARTLIAAGYFEAITFSDEDRQRATFYQDNARRTQILNGASDMNAYLNSLDMEMTLAPFNSTGRARITQLISKSNQFNLTTKRYDEIEVEQLEKDPSVFTRQIRLKDTLGDNGMISVVVCRKAADVWEIDTWLMSCRVLGRRVEEAVLHDLVSHAAQAGATRLVGRYIPSARNVIVKDHYKKLGFQQASEIDNIETWELDIHNYEFSSVPIKRTVAV
jgi:FkbH-like protein